MSQRLVTEELTAFLNEDHSVFTWRVAYSGEEIRIESIDIDGNLLLRMDDPGAGEMKELALTIVRGSSEGAHIPDFAGKYVGRFKEEGSTFYVFAPQYRPDRAPQSRPQPARSEPRKAPEPPRESEARNANRSPRAEAQRRPREAGSASRAGSDRSADERTQGK